MDPPDPRRLNSISWSAPDLSMILGAPKAPATPAMSGTFTSNSRSAASNSSTRLMVPTPSAARSGARTKSTGSLDSVESSRPISQSISRSFSGYTPWGGCVQLEACSPAKITRRNGTVAGNSMEVAVPSNRLRENAIKRPRESPEEQQRHRNAITENLAMNKLLEKAKMANFINHLLTTGIRHEPIREHGKQNTLVKHFLSQVRFQWENKFEQVRRELQMITRHLDRVSENTTPGIEQAAGPNAMGGLEDSNANRVLILGENFEGLKEFYLSKSARIFAGDPVEDGTIINDLTETFQQIVKFTGFRPLKSIRCGTAPSENHRVSTIEFDKDHEWMAAGGTGKTIKILNFDNLNCVATSFYTGTPIKTVSWSQFEKVVLASGDCTGSVNVWDTAILQRTFSFEGHDGRRCWSVDFSHTNRELLASCGEDSWIKLWSTVSPKMIGGINLPGDGHFCCVKFNSSDGHYLAAGSTDNCIYYYDIRNAKTFAQIFRGHEMSVSSVNFLDKETLVSRSTDGMIKLWRSGSRTCERTYSGQGGKSHFLGLSPVFGNLIVTGSEDNCVHVYHKNISTPLFKHKMPWNSSEGPSSFQGCCYELGGLVPPLTWRAGTNMVVAAASGEDRINFLELV